MEDKMQFSILVPVYNVKSYLPECIESIVNQTFQDFEVILVDDGSDDGSEKLCDQYGEKYKNIKVIHKKNQGLISARRMAMQQAKGEYCVFCDSDDFLEKNALEELNQVIYSNSPDMIIYNANLYNEDKEKKNFFTHVFQEGMVEKESVIDLLLLTYKVNSLCLKAVRHSILDVHKDYSPHYQYNYGEDLLQSIPLVLKAVHIYYLDKELYNYRTNSGITSRNDDRMFYQYRDINRIIRTFETELHCQDFEKKLGIHMLMHTCGAIGSLNYNGKLKDFAEAKQRLKVYGNDEDFRSAYKVSSHTEYMQFLGWKRKRIIMLLYHRHYNILMLIHWAIGIRDKRRNQSNG